LLQLHKQHQVLQLKFVQQLQLLPATPQPFQQVELQQAVELPQAV
jgi:predicted metal-dependent hydrolase